MPDNNPGKLHITDFLFQSINENSLLEEFDCDDADINEFLKEDALQYEKEKMASTYLFVDDEQMIVAFFSASNDCLKDT
jgi:hypothetical protein